MKLFVTDIDNTLFDWVSYYTKAIGAMLDVVSDKIGASKDQLKAEAKVIFGEHDSIEYPFLIQEMPTVIKHYGDDIDQMLTQLVRPARISFKEEAIKQLNLYEGVKETLEKIKTDHPNLPIVALTDAPRYVAMWKLNKLGILHDFSAIYGLADPRIPTDPSLGRVKVEAHILLKHLQQSQFDFAGPVRILPNDYEKPGVRGLKTVLMDYEEDPESVLWVGDNLGKDVKLGKKLGVTTAWAKYGTNISKEDMFDLNTFSPEDNIRKHASIGDHGKVEPHHTLESFRDVLDIL